MLLINCDLGERGVAHPIDDKLVGYIDIANIACGGHAGNKESVDYYVKLCRDCNVKITAHISYPDRENFGRKVIDIDYDTLCSSFDEQFALFDGEIKAIKPHGALYNELNVNHELAKIFVEWCLKNDIKELVVSPFGIVAEYAKEKSIKTIKESFAERGYMLDSINNPMLIPRGQPNAEIHDVVEAIKQYNQLKQGFITIDDQNILFESQTICIHSDSKIALELAQQLHKSRD
ncbi:5-oxoprolinase subunit PxpA [Francisella sciaenopsi]|uniref:5-oxoprolinase subunit PxpA n=1 Tax=Francisella sciaenopsi TaxID=3055034 RepID=A0ABQ6PHA2_9GAMM